MAQKYRLDQTFTHRSPTHESTIHWTRIGNSTLPPLIFIHGTPWSSVVWHDIAATLQDRFNIYLYDHPGFGDSPLHCRLDGLASDPHDDLDGSLIHRAEASAALFKHWDFPTGPHVVCHDNAGLVSLRLLLQHGIKFASLCLIDVVAIGPFGLPFFKLVAENEAVFAAIPPHLVEGFVRGYVRSAACVPLAKGVEDMLSAPWLADGRHGPGKFLREMVQAHNRSSSDIEGEYGRIAGLVPVKIIWGKEDAWIPVETAYRLKEALMAEELVVVEEAGHLIHYDQPSKLAVEVALWLEKNDKRKT